MHIPPLLVPTLLSVLPLPPTVHSSPAAASPPRLIVRQIQCAPIHLIVARESLSSPGTGVIGTLAQRIQDAHPGATTLEAIDYAATLDNYDSSSREGTRRTADALARYAKACPCSQIVMLGYSQGAHVIGDALCGGGGYLGVERTPPVDKAVSDRVFAIVFMGDPRHVPGQPFDAGTADQPGTFPRPPDISCEPFTRRLVSYCDRNDTYCASGQDIVTHLTYTDRYNQKGLDFVNSKLVKVGGGKKGELRL